MNSSHPIFLGFPFSFFRLPGRSTDEYEFSEELRAANGSQNPNHGGDGVADISATINAESIKDVEKVVDEGIKSGVAPEVKIVRIDAAGTDKVIENDTEMGQEIRENALPRGLIGAEAMGENKHPLAVPNYSDIQSFQEGVTHVRQWGGRAWFWNFSPKNGYGVYELWYRKDG